MVEFVGYKLPALQPDVIILVFRKLNHKEVVEEDRRNKEPKNEEARKRRAEYIVKVSTFTTTKNRLIFMKLQIQKIHEKKSYQLNNVKIHVKNGFMHIKILL